MGNDAKHSARPNRLRRLAWSIAAGLSIALSITGVADRLGEHYADEAFSRALVTFAAARTLNGVISVAQGTELAVEPAGVGVIFSLGQILDPINDLVERFSTVMLVATTSLGLQNVLLDMTAWWGVSGVLLLAASLLLLSLWWPGQGSSRWSSLALRFFLVTVFLRFAVPLLIIATNLVFDNFLAAEQQAAVTALENTRSEIEAVNQASAVPEDQSDSMVERLNNWLDRSMESMNVEAQLEDLATRVSQSTEHIINLIVIFIFQTILLPLASLWLLVEGLKSLGRRGANLAG
jgi:hypothetical protein